MLYITNICYYGWFKLKLLYGGLGNKINENSGVPIDFEIGTSKNYF